MIILGQFSLLLHKNICSLEMQIVTYLTQYRDRPINHQMQWTSFVGYVLATAFWSSNTILTLNIKTPKLRIMLLANHSIAPDNINPAIMLLANHSIVPDNINPAIMLLANHSIAPDNTRGPRATIRSPEWHSHCRHADVMRHFSNPIIATNENIIIWAVLSFEEEYMGLTVNGAWSFE